MAGSFLSVRGLEKCLVALLQRDFVKGGRRHRDQLTFKIVKFDLQAGIAGFVAISAHSLITENVQSETKFNPEIDDPKAPANSPA